jgi:hypothetical protein
MSTLRSALRSDHLKQGFSGLMERGIPLTERLCDFAKCHVKSYDMKVPGIVLAPAFVLPAMGQHVTDPRASVVDVDSRQATPRIDCRPAFACHREPALLHGQSTAFQPAVSIVSFPFLQNTQVFINRSIAKGKGLLWRGLFQTVTALRLIELVELNSPLLVRLDARISTFSNRST